jgi:hypothetical protein
MPRFRRRWYQFTLRTLLLFTLLCSIPFGWVGSRMEKARRQKKAVESLLALRGRVVYDCQLDGSGYFVENAEPRGPGWLRSLLGDDMFRSVVEARVEDDAGLRCLKELSSLTDLYAGRFGGAVDLSSSVSFVFEWPADDAQVTDAGLEELKALRNLRRLCLDWTQVTDAGLCNLACLTQLRELDLYRTRVTDAGLEHLKGLSRLKKLNLLGTDVTAEGVRRLKESLPDCEIWGRE